MEQLKKMLEFTGIDVDHLVDLYTNTLHANNNWYATREGSIIALKEWAENNNWLIRQVMAMPGYNGNLQSVGFIDVPYKRNSNDTYNAIARIWSRLFDDGNKILSRVNDDGKTIEELVKEELTSLPARVSVMDLGKYSGKQYKSFSDFETNGYTKKSINERSNAYSLVHAFNYYTSTRVDDNLAKAINNIDQKIGAMEGMKTTRALGKIIKKYGLEDRSKGSTYGEEFIRNYCETTMREGGIRRLFVLSVHPVDYLKMSIGHFTSCHNINGGGWRSGCIAYMLDKVSMIGYTIDPKSETTDPVTGEVVCGKDRPELFAKWERNVFHWDENYRLIQSRVYPQANDGNMDIRKVMRLETQARIAKANGWDPDNWTNRKRKYTEFTVEGNGATNYPDWKYEGFGGNLSTPGKPNDSYSTETLTIGTQPTCVICGRKHTRSSQMTCGCCR